MPRGLALFGALLIGFLTYLLAAQEEPFLPPVLVAVALASFLYALWRGHTFLP